MVRFLKGAGSVLLAVALALTWTWTGYLKDAGYINDRQRLSILLTLTLLLALQQIYLVIPKPEKRGVIEERRNINEYYLKSFYLTYYEKLKTVCGTASPPVIRLNVMLPTRRVKGLFGSYLQIYYYLVPPGRPYTDAERDLRWKGKEGTCGWAWKCRTQSIFDSKTPQLSLSEKRLNAAKKLVVGHLKSTLSVPIWQGTKVVGVFSLDSEQNVDQTFFDHPDVFGLAVAFARDFGAQCYPDGIES